MIKVASTTIGPGGGTISGAVTGGVVTVTVDPGTFSSPGPLVLCTRPLSALNNDPSNPTIGFFAVQVPDSMDPNHPLHITLVGNELTPTSYVQVQAGGGRFFGNFQASAGRVSFDAYSFFEYAVFAHRPTTPPPTTPPTNPPPPGLGNGGHQISAGIESAIAQLQAVRSHLPMQAQRILDQIIGQLRALEGTLR